MYCKQTSTMQKQFFFTVSASGNIVSLMLEVVKLNISYQKKSAEVSLISFTLCGIFLVETKRLVSLTTDGYDF